MAQKITLKKIAQDLKVSISTVSKALRDSHEISIETRDKIKEYASFPK
jgi:LacI family transcriptional regulator